MLLQNLQVELIESIFGEPDANLVVPAQHLEIYRHNIMQTLLKALREIYPLICKLFGDDFFTQTASEYIKQYPSCSGNIHDYGEYFADFLAEYAPVADLIYLAEVATFEWICHGLQFAADHTALNLDALANIPQEEYDALHFVLHPASHLHKFHYPLLQIIDLCKGLLDEEIDLDVGGVNLLMIRRNADVMLVPLTEADYIFLTQLQEGNTLALALEHAKSFDPDFHLENKLPAWVQDKTLVDCYVIS